MAHPFYRNIIATLRGVILLFSCVGNHFSSVRFTSNLIALSDINWCPQIYYPFSSLSSSTRFFCHNKRLNEIHSVLQITSEIFYTVYSQKMTSSYEHMCYVFSLSSREHCSSYVSFIQLNKHVNHMSL